MMSRWPKRLSVDDQAEIVRLKRDATNIEEDRRYFHLIFDLQAVRRCQLYRTLLHEVGVIGLITRVRLILTRNHGVKSGLQITHPSGLNWTNYPVEYRPGYSGYIAHITTKNPSSIVTHMLKVDPLIWL